MDQKTKQEMLSKIRRYKNLAQTVGAAALLAGYVGLGRYCKQQLENSARDKMRKEKTTGVDPYADFRPFENQTVLGIGLVEGFSSRVYYCGVRNTIGFGTTEYPDGSRVQADDPPVDHLQAKEMLISALEREAYPCIDKFVRRKLSPEQKIALAMFIYNIGPKQFTGLDTCGVRVAPEAQLLTRLNSGRPIEECARCFSGFRAVKGKRSTGLLKRRWWEAAVFTGKIRPEQMLYLDPGKVYGNLSLEKIYTGTEPDKDNFYTPRLDDKTVREVLKLCRGSRRHCMAALLDAGTALALGDTLIHKKGPGGARGVYDATVDFIKNRGR